MTIKIVNLGNNLGTQNNCNDISPVPASINNEPPSTFCENDNDLGWLIKDKKTGLGKSKQCDPMISGQIVNDVRNPNPNVINRYTKAIRGCDEAIQDLLKDLVVIDDSGKAWPIPCIWGTQEKAVAEILQNNVRKDNSLVVDRITLPMLAVSQVDCQFNQNRYVYHKAVNYLRKYKPGYENLKPGATLDEGGKEHSTILGVSRGIPVDIAYGVIAWTLYQEDMNQILEQMFLKFSPLAYIQIRGVPWEIAVRLDTTQQAIDAEPGDQNIRVIKFQFNLTAEAYIPQPIIRKKSVLKVKTDIYNSVNPEEITSIFDRLETTVNNL